MYLPATAAPYAFLMSAGGRFVTINSSLAVSAVVERVTNKAILQSNTNFQPTWGRTSLSGTFSSTNTPSTTGIAGLTFATNDSLEFDSLASELVTNPNFTVTTVVNCPTATNSTAQTVWGLGSGTSTPTLALQYQSSNFNFTEVNSNGTYTASAATDNKTHVVTCIKNNNVLTLRVDGAQVATQNVTAAGVDQFSTFCIGGLNSNGSVSANFNGTLADVIVWFGAADVQATEAFLLQFAGVVRSTTLY